MDHAWRVVAAGERWYNPPMKWLGEKPFHSLLLLTEKPDQWPVWTTVPLAVVLAVVAGLVWANATDGPVLGWITALSFYSPGIPSGGLFIMTPVYMALGLPVEGIGLLIALDMIPDMFITTANVTADMTVAVVLGRRNGSTTVEAVASDATTPSIT